MGKNCSSARCVVFCFFLTAQPSVQFVEAFRDITAEGNVWNQDMDIPGGVFQVRRVVLVPMFVWSWFQCFFVCTSDTCVFSDADLSSNLKVLRRLWCCLTIWRCSRKSLCRYQGAFGELVGSGAAWARDCWDLGGAQSQVGTTRCGPL